MLPPVKQVSVMTSQHATGPQGTRAEGPDPPGERRGEWPMFPKTIVEPADPMQSETVKRWLLSDLRAPR